MTGDGERLIQSLTPTQGTKKRLEAMGDLRDYIDSMPESQQTFTRTDIDGWYHTNFSDEMMWMAGSWPAADTFTSDVTLWINPRGRHAWHYPTVKVRCKCGALMTHSYQSDLNGEHKDCMQWDRLRARADLMEKRQAALLKGLHHGWSSNKQTAAVGLRGEGVSLYDATKKYGINSKKERRKWKVNRQHTFVYLRNHTTVDVELIAKALGTTRRTLTESMPKYTDYYWDGSKRRWVKDE